MNSCPQHGQVKIDQRRPGIDRRGVDDKVDTTEFGVGFAIHSPRNPS
jgi:hypothetical protein